ncbi:MAG: hypothetical protein EB060_10650 [Proteobacteria bacterium]|nr:hypothetical protein [Pseudomonadota bacterium]
MDKDLEAKLKYLRLTELLESWDELMAQAKEKGPTYPAFTKQMIDLEITAKRERARQQRLRRSKPEEMYLIETYPFDRQPGVPKKKIIELFDSMNYLRKKQNVIFVGPTGVGKTGLATALMIHAINSGASGRFITFPALLDELYRSVADHSEKKVLKKFLSYEVLVVDELGYLEIDPQQAGLFFTLMKQRHKKATTIVTTQLGFKEWAGFLKNPHLTLALIDRLTENSQLINMGKCQSLRDNRSTDSKSP